MLSNTLISYSNRVEVIPNDKVNPCRTWVTIRKMWPTLGWPDIMCSNHPDFQNYRSLMTSKLRSTLRNTSFTPTKDQHLLLSRTRGEKKRNLEISMFLLFTVQMYFEHFSLINIFTLKPYSTPLKKKIPMCLMQALNWPQGICSPIKCWSWQVYISSNIWFPFHG